MIPFKAMEKIKATITRKWTNNCVLDSRGDEALKKAMGRATLKAVIVSECFEDREYKEALLEGVCSVLPKELVLGGARSLRGYREEQFHGTATALGTLERFEAGPQENTFEVLQESLPRSTIPAPLPPVAVDRRAWALPLARDHLSTPRAASVLLRRSTQHELPGLRASRHIAPRGRRIMVPRA